MNYFLGLIFFFFLLPDYSVFHSQVVFAGDGVRKVEDEYMETQYYSELDSIDKQHHTVR